MINRLREKAISQGYAVIENGWPDFLIKREDGLKAIKVKVPNDKPRENQIEMLQALDGAGFKCYVYRPMNPEAEEPTPMPVEELLNEREKEFKPIGEIIGKSEWTIFIME